MKQLIPTIIIYLFLSIPLLAQINFALPEISISRVNVNSMDTIDMDDDGLVDIVGVGSRITGGFLSWWQNLGNGSFQYYELYSNLENEGRRLEIGDIDEDGDLDFVVTDGRPDSKGSLLLLRNNQGQYSQEVIAEDVLADDILMVDIDMDGDIDVICSGNFGSFGSEPGTKLYKNDGEELFSEITLSTIDRGRLYLGDFNNDGKSEISVGGKILRISEGGNVIDNVDIDDDSFVSQRDRWPVDVDGDGDFDFVSAATNPENRTRQLALHRNDTGSFVDVFRRNLDGENVKNVIAANLDVDPNREIILTRASAGFGRSRPTQSIEYYKFSNEGFIEKGFISNLSFLNEGLLAMDFDNDGDNDILVSSSVDGIDIYENTKAINLVETNFDDLRLSPTEDLNLIFSQPIEDLSVDSVSFSVYGSKSGYIAGEYLVNGYEIAFNHSGELIPGELVRVTLTRQIKGIDGDYTMSPITKEFTVSTPSSEIRFDSTNQIKAIDFSGGDSSFDTKKWNFQLIDHDDDGDIDIFMIENNFIGDYIRNRFLGGVALFENIGGQIFEKRLIGTLSEDGRDGFTLFDVNRDGLIDLIDPDDEFGPPDVYLFDRYKKSFVESESMRVQSFDDNILIADFDNNGLNDALTGTAIHPNALLRNREISFTVTRRWSNTVLLRDIDLNGYVDAVFSGIRYTRNGSEFVTGSVEKPETLHPFSIADVDNDGDWDLIGKRDDSFDTDLSWFENNGSAEFFRRDIPNTPSISAAKSIDIDGDDFDDIIVLGWGSLYILQNLDGNGFNKILINDDAFERFTSGQLVDAADMDGDDDLDIVIVTVDGVKIYYQATGKMPKVLNTIPDQELTRGFQQFEIDISNIFVDADNQNVTFEALATNDTVINTSVSSDKLVLTEVGVGSTVIVLSATDPDGNIASTKFLLTVTQAPPVVEQSFSDLELYTGFNTYELNVSQNFSDPEGDTLSFSAESSNRDIILTTVSDSTLTLLEMGMPGVAIISVTADDGQGGEVETAFSVTLSENTAPEVVAQIEDLTLDEGFSEESVDLSQVFSDPDDDTLSYKVTSSDTDIVTVAVDGSILTIEEVAAGVAYISVIADDGNGGTAEEQFKVTVNREANQPPEVVSAIDNQSFTEGFSSSDLDISTNFSDPEEDKLIFTIEIVDETVVTGEVNSSNLTFFEQGIGSTEIIVTADDQLGGTIASSFFVAVNSADNQRPVITQSIEQQELEEGFQSFTMDLSQYFEDPDNDDLLYLAGSEDLSVVSVDVNQSELKINEEGTGSTEIRVVVDDDRGGIVEQYFVVSVEGTLNVNEDKFFKVFPNPTSGEIMLSFPIKLPNAESINLTDLSGKQQKVTVTKKGIDSYLVQLSQLPAAIYFLNFDIDYKSYSIRIIKK